MVSSFYLEILRLKHGTAYCDCQAKSERQNKKIHRIVCMSNNYLKQNFLILFYEMQLKFVEVKLVQVIFKAFLKPKKKISRVYFFHS